MPAVVTTDPALINAPRHSRHGARAPRATGLRAQGTHALSVIANDAHPRFGSKLHPLKSLRSSPYFPQHHLCQYTQAAHFFHHILVATAAIAVLPSSPINEPCQALHPHVRLMSTLPEMAEVSHLPKSTSPNGRHLYDLVRRPS